MFDFLVIPPGLEGGPNVTNYGLSGRGNMERELRNYGRVVDHDSELAELYSRVGGVDGDAVGQENNNDGDASESIIGNDINSNESVINNVGGANPVGSVDLTTDSSEIGVMGAVAVVSAAILSSVVSVGGAQEDEEEEDDDLELAD